MLFCWSVCINISTWGLRIAVGLQLSRIDKKSIYIKMFVCRAATIFLTVEPQLYHTNCYLAKRFITRHIFLFLVKYYDTYIIEGLDMGPFASLLLSVIIDLLVISSENYRDLMASVTTWNCPWMFQRIFPYIVILWTVVCLSMDTFSVEIYSKRGFAT